MFCIHTPSWKISVQGAPYLHTIYSLSTLSTYYLLIIYTICTLSTYYQLIIYTIYTIYTGCAGGTVGQGALAGPAGQLLLGGGGGAESRGRQDLRQHGLQEGWRCGRVLMPLHPCSLVNIYIRYFHCRYSF